jgi:hypothetical protein
VSSRSPAIQRPTTERANGAQASHSTSHSGSPPVQ